MSTRTLPTPTVASDVVPVELIRRYLPLYKPEYVHIRNVRYGERSLTADFDFYPLEFHREPLNHLSRVQIVHYLGQAAFVIGGCMARENLMSPLTEDGYVSRVEKGLCTFQRLELNFHRYLPNTAGTTISMSCKEIQRAGASLLFELGFSLNEGSCHGVARAFVPLSD